MSPRRPKGEIQILIIKGYQDMRDSASTRPASTPAARRQIELIEAVDWRALAQDLRRP